MIPKSNRLKVLRIVFVYLIHIDIFKLHTAVCFGRDVAFETDDDNELNENQQCDSEAHINVSNCANRVAHRRKHGNREPDLETNYEKIYQQKKIGLCLISIQKEAKDIMVIKKMGTNRMAK